MAANPANAELVPEPLRRPLAVAVGVAAVVFAVLAVRFAGTSEAGSVDMRVDAVVDPLGVTHRALVEYVLQWGAPLQVTELVGVLVVASLLLGRRRLAVLAVVGPGVTGLCTTLLKPVVGRTIGGEFAFPSGHTGGATAVGLVAALLVISLARPGRAGALAILAAAAVVVGGAVGTAMVATNTHYPTDVLGGFCTAFTVVCGSALLLDRLAQRRSLRATSADG